MSSDVLEVMRKAHACFSGEPAADIYKARAAVAELIAASEEFSELYGRLWDTVDPEDGGWLSSDSVKDYDAAHDRLSSALAACKESSHG